MRTITQLPLRNVITITRTAKLARTAEYLANKSDSDLALLVRATATSLTRLTQAGIAPEVRLPREAVESQLWTIYKAAKAELARRKASAAEAEELATERAAFWAAPCGICGAPRNNCYC